MAKKKPAKRETKSDFLRKVLGKNPDLDYEQVNRRWTKAGHPGTISNALYYQVRSKMGIRTVWQWVRVSDPEAEAGPGPARSSTSGSSPPPVSGEVYQLKITLNDSR